MKKYSFLISIIAALIFNAGCQHGQSKQSVAPATAADTDTISCFDIQMQLPVGSAQLPQKDPAALHYYNIDSETIWFVERRGSEAISLADMPLGQLTKLFASGMGVKDELTITDAMIDSRPAGKISFTLDNFNYVTCITKNGGFVYAIGISSPKIDMSDLNTNADQFFASIKFSEDIQAAPPISVSSLADLGIECTTCSDLMISKIPGQDGLALMDYTNRMALIILRTPSMDFNKDKATAATFQSLFENDGLNVQKATDTEIHGNTAYFLECTKVGNDGSTIASHFYIVPRSESFLMFNFTCEIEKQADLAAFAAEIIKGLSFK